MAFRNRLGARTWLVLAGLIIFALAMLPRLVSSRLVYGPLLDRLRAENFKLDVGSVQPRWFSPIHLNDISIEQIDRPGFKLLSVDEVITEKGLLGFLWSQNQLGQLDIISPVIDVELLQDGSRAGLQQPAMIAVTNMLAKLVGSDSDGEVMLVDGSQINVKWKDGFVYHQGTRFPPNC